MNNSFLERGFDRIGVINFWRGVQGFLVIAIVNLTSQLSFDLLLMRRLRDIVSCVIFHYVLSLFRSVKCFLIVFYFINSSLKSV